MAVNKPVGDNARNEAALTKNLPFPKI